MTPVVDKDKFDLDSLKTNVPSDAPTVEKPSAEVPANTPDNDKKQEPAVDAKEPAAMREPATTATQEPTSKLFKMYVAPSNATDVNEKPASEATMATPKKQDQMKPQTLPQTGTTENNNNIFYSFFALFSGLFVLFTRNRNNRNDA